MFISMLCISIDSLSGLQILCGGSVLLADAGINHINLAAAAGV